MEELLREQNRTAASSVPALEPQIWLPHPPPSRARLESERKRRKGIAFGFAAAAALVLLGITSGAPAVVKGVVLGYMVLALLGVACLSSECDESTPEDDLLVADSEHGEDILVRMWVEVDGVVRGSDRGVVWYDETGYCFYGHRSWFRIAQSDIVPRRQPRLFSVKPELDTLERVTILEVRSPSGRVRIGLKEISRGSPFARPDDRDDRLAYHLRSFEILNNAQSLPTSLPPTEFDSTLRDVGYRRFSGCAGVGWGLFLAVAFLATFLGSPFLVFGIPAASFLLYKFGPNWLSRMRAFVWRTGARSRNRLGSLRSRGMPSSPRRPGP